MSHKPTSTLPTEKNFRDSHIRLFRDSLQLCSGLVDLVIGVCRHVGGGHRLALMGKRIVSLVTEDLTQVARSPC